MPRIDRRTALKGLAGFALAAMIWASVSPLYDSFISAAAEEVIRAFERPRVTHLNPKGTHVTVDRSDFDPRSPRPGLPVFDLTFNWVLLAALFALTRRPFSDRNLLGFVIASLILSVTHVLALVTEVMSIYVLRLGAWSRVHYGPFARNFWGATNHSYRFVLMFAIAFGLWWALRPSDDAAASGSSRKASRRQAR